MNVIMRRTPDVVEMNLTYTIDSAHIGTFTSDIERGQFCIKLVVGWSSDKEPLTYAN